jgi:hypothetical protein
MPLAAHLCPLLLPDPGQPCVVNRSGGIEGVAKQSRCPPGLLRHYAPRNDGLASARRPLLKRGNGRVFNRQISE